jgi:hypothetical protein
MNRAQRRALMKPGARRYFERQRQHDARAAAAAPVPDSMLTDIGLALHASLLSLQTGRPRKATPTTWRWRPTSACCCASWAWPRS